MRIDKLLSRGLPAAAPLPAPAQESLVNANASRLGKVSGHNPVTDFFPARIREKQRDVLRPVASTRQERYTRAVRRLLQNRRPPPMDKGVVFSQIRAADGKSIAYTVGPKVSDGAHAKFRVAVGADNKLYGVRELRLVEKANGRSTYAVSYADDILRELRILKKVGSTQAPVDVFVVDDKLWLVVPLEDGDMHGLQKLQRKYGIVPSREEMHAVVLSLLRSVGSDLARCDAAGVMYRDVKPENILVSRDGVITLADYGDACEATSADMREAVGTNCYMAPERLLAKSLDERYTAKADMFSLGVTTLLSMGTDESLWPGAADNTEAQSRAAAAQYVSWYAARSVSGKVDWQAVAAAQARGGQEGFMQDLDTLALQAHSSAPLVAAYVFDHLMCVDPAARDCAEQVVNFTASHWQEDVHAPRAAQHLDTVLSEGATYEDLAQAAIAYRDF